MENSNIENNITFANPVINANDDYEMYRLKVAPINSLESEGWEESTGSVIIFFSNGDPSYSTLSISEGNWNFTNQEKVVHGKMFIADNSFHMGNSGEFTRLEVYNSINVSNEKELHILGDNSSNIKFHSPYAGLEVTGTNSLIEFDNSVPLEFDGSGIEVLAESGGKIKFPTDTEFANGSTLILSASTIELEASEELLITSGSSLEIYGTPTFTFGTNAKIKIEQGGKLIIKSANTTNGWLAGNISISGDNWEVNGEITVEENANLTMSNFESPNDDVTLPDANAKITVNGYLTASNSTFSSISGNDTWFGFWVDGTTAGLNLTECSLTKATIGIYGNALIDNAINVSSSTISDCYLGVLVQNNSSGTFKINSSTLIDDNSFGIYVSTNGNASIENSTVSNSVYDGVYVGGLAYSIVRGTTFSDNSVGVRIKGGFADLGQESSSGNNVFYDNTTYDVEHVLVTQNPIPTVPAWGNYWTSGVQECNNPLGNVCYDNDGTPISGCYPVAVQPTAECGGLPKITSTSPDLQAFVSALNEESDENYSQAESQFLNFLTNFPTSVYKPHAIAGLLRTKKALSKSNEIIPFLNNIISVGSGDDVLVAKEFAVMQHTLESDFSSATVKMNDVLNAYTGTPKEIFALVEADYLTNIQSQQGSLTKANFGASQKLSSKFTDSPEALASEILSKIKTQEEVALEYVNALPTDFELLQNYPNPFNPKTQIEFALKKNLNVSLKIFNTLGQEVKTLVNEIKPTGIHRIEWNGTDSNGSQVASGVYFYKLEVGQQSQTKKMLFLK